VVSSSLMGYFMGQCCWAAYRTRYNISYYLLY
jgi:hypothetical protein